MQSERKAEISQGASCNISDLHKTTFCHKESKIGRFGGGLLDCSLFIKGRVLFSFLFEGV